MKRLDRLTAIKIISTIAYSYFVPVYLVMPWYDSQVTVDSAIGQLARAESAQTRVDLSGQISCKNVISNPVHALTACATRASIDFEIHAHK